MKKICIAVVSASALLGLASLANAQGTKTEPGTGANAAGSSNRCWDVSTNMVRDKNAGGSTSGAATGTNTTTGTAGPGAPGKAGSGTGPTTAAARPAGMPNC